MRTPQEISEELVTLRDELAAKGVSLPNQTAIELISEFMVSAGQILAALAPTQEPAPAPETTPAV